MSTRIPRRGPYPRAAARQTGGPRFFTLALPVLWFHGLAMLVGLSAGQIIELPALRAQLHLDATVRTRRTDPDPVPEREPEPPPIPVLYPIPEPEAEGPHLTPILSAPGGGEGAIGGPLQSKDAPEPQAI